MEVATRHAFGHDATFKAYLEAALDCVVVADGQGQVVEFNPAAEQTFGYSRGEALGKPLSDLIVPPSLRERHARALAAFAATRVPTILGRRLELTAMRADGSEFPIELVLSQVGGEPLLVCASIRDLSDARRAESDLRALAAEQEALRGVATLVARGAPAVEVFAAVCVETAQLTGATHVNLDHFMPGGVNLTEAGWSLHETHLPAGTRLPLEGGTVRDLIRQGDAPARVDDYDHVPGALADLIRRRGIRSEVGAPVVVQGQLWGALVAGTDRSESLPASAEQRVASFAELVATAVSNMAARSELIESRARVVASADASRKKLTRDLHDGAQQQFVNAVINLQLAQRALRTEPDRAGHLLDVATQEAMAGLDTLRDLAAGIHPSLLTTRGLSVALEELVGRLPLAVRLDVDVDRLPPAIEASAYYFCSEALTNVVKHAQATSAGVKVARVGDVLTIEVSDDGKGGATTESGGTGLLGLYDRVGALGGTLEVASPAFGGTTLRGRIPIPSRST